MLRKILLVSLSWLFITVLTLAFLGSASQRLLAPEPYEEAFDQAGYADFGARLGLDGLGARVAENATRTALRATIAYINGDVDRLHIPFRPRAVLGSLPDCAPGTIPSPDSLCVPVGVNQSQVEELLAEMVPAEIDLAEHVNTSGIEHARAYVATARQALFALYALAVLLAALILFVARHHILGGVKMLEADLLVVGGSLLGSSLVVRHQLDSLIPTHLGALGGVVEHLLVIVLGALTLYGAIVGAVGLVTLLASSAITIERE